MPGTLEKIGTVASRCVRELRVPAALCNDVTAAACASSAAAAGACAIERPPAGLARGCQAAGSRGREQASEVHQPKQGQQGRLVARSQAMRQRTMRAGWVGAHGSRRRPQSGGGGGSEGQHTLGLRASTPSPPGRFSPPPGPFSQCQRPSEPRRADMPQPPLPAAECRRPSEPRLAYTPQPPLPAWRSRCPRWRSRCPCYRRRRRPSRPAKLERGPNEVGAVGGGHRWGP